MILRLDYVILNEVKNLLAMCSLSTVRPARRSLDRLGMTFIVSMGNNR